jgi:hypothetical protein
MGQLGFFDLNRRYESLTEKNDPLVTLRRWFRSIERNQIPFLTLVRQKNTSKKILQLS